MSLLGGKFEKERVRGREGLLLVQLGTQHGDTINPPFLLRQDRSTFYYFRLILRSWDFTMQASSTWVEECCCR